MLLITYFDVGGAPVTGLTPIVKIRDIDTGAVVISGATMGEVGDGFYVYDFVGFDITKDYSILSDSVTLSTADRYKHSATGEYGDIINNVNLASDNIELRVTLIKKILTNKLELFDGDTKNWKLYDDDSTTLLFEWNVTDKNDSLIVQESNVDSKRTKGS